MSFVEFLRDDPQLTREQVMATLIRVADELDMPDKRGAVVIAGMVISQEVGVEDGDPPHLVRFWCPANHNDETSFQFDHDSISDDGRSCGYFQQQRGPQFQEWWGPVSSEMDLHSAATQFMSRLKRAGYNASDAVAAASSGCAIQNPADHAGYIAHCSGFWGDINGLYDSVIGGVVVSPPDTNPPVATPFFPETNLIDGSGSQPRGGQRPRLFVLHTEEGNMVGQDLDRWMDDNRVSYHYIVSNDRAWDLVDTDRASWSVLSANPYTVNLVFTPSFAHWTRGEWLQNMGNGIKIAAYLCAQDCKKYGIPPVVRVGNSASGYPSLQANDGVTDHYGITVGLGIGNHTDVGGGFPWDIFNQYLQKFMGGITEEDDMFSDADRELLQRVHFELTNLWHSRSIYREPDEPPLDTLAGFTLDNNSMTYEERVETSAIRGDFDCVRRLFRTAAGEGAEKADWAVQRAENALRQVPQEVIEAYEAYEEANK